MATINASQDYDIVQTLTFAEASGTCKIRLHRGYSSTYTGTVKIREGTSGTWSDLSVSGTATAFNVTSTTMQIAHDWNKNGNDYMTCSFYGQITNLTEIAISQKAVLSGVVGNYFMQHYAYGCKALTSLSVPDTSSITSVGSNFMYRYAYVCAGLTSLSVSDTSSITSVGNTFMSDYAYDCAGLTSLSVPDTSNITTIGHNFMSNYAYNCTALTTLVLPSVGWFATHDVDWGVPSSRLNYLKGEVLDSSDLADWQALTTSASPNTLYLNYIRNTEDVYYDYDIIQTLTFDSASGTCNIILHRGSSNAYTGTVKVREGTSGAWSDLSVSGTATTFNVTNTTMQVAHDWNKSGNNYMTCSFASQSTNLTKIFISQKEVLSGDVGNYFMYDYAYNCKALTSLDIPDTSGITSVGNYFMYRYAYGCIALTSLSVPDTSNITTIGSSFMYRYAYACNALTTLVLPSVGWFATHNIDWSVPSSRLNYLKGEVLDSSDLADWQALTTSTSPNTLYLNYIRKTADVYLSVLTTIAESIGFQISLEYDKEGAVGKTVAITNSIGQQYTSTQAKSIPKTLSSTIGYQSNTAFNKNINATLSSSIGNQDAIVISKSISSELNSSIGNQDNLVLSKNIDTTILSSMGQQFNIDSMNTIGTALSSSIGQQMVLDFTKATTLTIGSSIAEQYSSVVTKNIDEELSSSIGDKYAYTYTTAIDTDDFEVEILGSIGEQHNLASYKNIDVELASSIGFNQVIDFTKASSNSITQSIGFNESYSYSSSAGLKTTSITNSIGVQENIGYSKSISSVISSVIGQHYEQDYSKNTLLQCNNSIGFIYIKLGNKDTSSTLLSSIGFNYRIRNVYPYIASEDFYLTKDENNTSVSGETNNFNLVGQKNNFNLVGKEISII